MQYLLAGFSLLWRPELRAFVIGPLLINIALFAALISYAFHQFTYWLAQLMPQLPEWLSWLNYLLWPLFVLVLLVVIIYGFTVVATIVASPFLSLLAEKADYVLSGKAITPASFASVLKSIPHSIGRELHKLFSLIPWLLLVVIVTFVPALNVVSPVLWFLLGAWSMAVNYCDYIADIQGKSFAQVKTTLRQQRWQSLQFGASVAAASMIPLINIVVMPAAVCGAVLLWRQWEEKGSAAS